MDICIIPLEFPKISSTEKIQESMKTQQTKQIQQKRAQKNMQRSPQAVQTKFRMCHALRHTYIHTIEL
jgi:hypothetical protein